MASTPISNFAFFSDREAWNIFRLVAFGEAFGWTLLISGIVWQHFGLPNSGSVLKVLGQTHGTLFFAYFAGLLAVAGSLRLSRLQFIIAAAVSIPPYGTLIYEKYLGRKRRAEAAKSHRELVVHAVIVQGSKLLAVQPKRGTFWCMPGGRVAANMIAEAALQQLVMGQLGVKVTVGALLCTQEYTHHGQLRLELFYEISSPTKMQVSHWQLTEHGKKQYDEIAFITPKNTKDLLPEFLQTATLFSKSK